MPQSSAGAKPQESSVTLAQEEAKTLSLLERVQVGSVLGTGLLAITYVSGYLTATTYLGTYGITADASALFRAKYLYVGFEYWLFVAIFGVFFYVSGLVVSVFSASAPPGDPKEMEDGGKQTKLEKRSWTREQEKELVARVLLWRRMHPGSYQQRIRSLRWGFSMALITTVFSFEILLMRPMEFKSYLPLQALFLLCFSLYQTTFYREYSEESYTWGLVYGVSLVRWIRWAYSLVTGTIFAGLMLAKALHVHLKGLSKWEKVYIWAHNLGTSAWFWVLASIFILVTFLVASFVTVSTTHLKWFDRWRRESRADRRRKAKRKATPARKRHRVVFSFFCVFFRWVFFFCVIWHACIQFVKGVFGKPSPSSSGLSPNGQMVRMPFVLRAIDSVVLPTAAGCYCWIAFYVWKHGDARISAIICGYCTLVFALVVLANMLRLFRLNILRDAALRLEELERWVREKRDTPAMSKGSTSEKVWNKWRESSKNPKGSSSAELWKQWMRLAVPITVLYLVSIVGFAHLVYPFVPVDKAGGNYSSSAPILIWPNSSPTECSSADLDNLLKLQPKIVVLEEAADWLYLAPEGSGGGPNCWKWGAFCSPQTIVAAAASARGNAGAERCSTDSPFRPCVYQVSARCIASVNVERTPTAP